MNHFDDESYMRYGRNALTPYSNYDDSLQRLLDQTMRNMEKRKARIEQGGPYLRVNTQPLQEIVPFLAFKCHPDSSIGRNVAVHGSDIDGGLVITEEPADSTTQQTFINELRRQGFDVYSESEYQRVTAELEAMQDTADINDVLEKIKQQRTMESKKIEFQTEKQLKQRYNDREMSLTLAVYANGYEIK